MDPGLAGHTLEASPACGEFYMRKRLTRSTPASRATWTAATLALAAFAIILGCRTPKEDPDLADLVLLNGRILTVDAQTPEVQALAARGETILALGSDAEIGEFIGAKTEVIDLQGMLAIPGFIEGHGHFTSLGQSLMELDLRDARSWDEIVDMVAEAAKEAEPGEWIVGRGWHQDKWDRPPSPSVEGQPTHWGLSMIVPDNPVLLTHTSGHGAIVNSEALERGGIDRDTPDPPGGEIVRDERGDATGMLREEASVLVERVLARERAARPAAVIEAEAREYVRLASEEAIRNGITSFQDMGSRFATVDLLKQLADEGELKLRLSIAIEEDTAVMAPNLAKYRMVGYGNGYLTVRTIGEKVLDGALGTHGGWLLEPYRDLPRSVGLNVTPIEEIRRSAELAIPAHPARVPPWSGWSRLPGEVAGAPARRRRRPADCVPRPL